jgi:transcriptional regulator with XRE-family HTH domain
MNFLDLHTDEAVLAELGRRLAQLRIDRNITQAELARKAGVGKRTLERLEAGETTQTRTLFRLLRELDLFEKLELVFPEVQMRPRDVVQKRNEVRKRASKAKNVFLSNEPWVWGDERIAKK